MKYTVHYSINRQPFFEECDASDPKEAKAIIINKYPNCLILNVTMNVKLRDHEYNS